jgi:hypothetical protein
MANGGQKCTDPPTPKNGRVALRIAPQGTRHKICAGIRSHQGPRRGELVWRPVSRALLAGRAGLIN